MIVEYTGRHFVVAEKYKAQAAAGLEQIGKLLGRAASAHVILEVDKRRMIAEVTVVDGSQNMVSNCESAEMKTALHDALAKVEQQAIRHKQKNTAGMRHPREAGVRGMEEALPAEEATPSL